MNESAKSVYTLGAEDGLVMGPLMTLVAVLVGASTYVSWLAVPGMLAALSVPVMAYLKLAVSRRNAPRTTTMTSLWLQGICMFFFGGLIVSVVAFILMRWMVPGFIVHQVDMIISVYGQLGDPSAQSMVDTFEKLKSGGGLPTPLDIALELLYMAVFTGSILSLIFSIIICRRRPVPPPFRPGN